MQTNKFKRPLLEQTNSIQEKSVKTIDKIVNSYFIYGEDQSEEVKDRCQFVTFF